MKKGDKFKVGINNKGQKGLTESNDVSTVKRIQDLKAIRDNWPLPDKPLNNVEEQEKIRNSEKHLREVLNER